MALTLLAIASNDVFMMTTAKKIKILMVEKEVSGAEIARSLGFTRTAVYHVIAGKRKSPRIRTAIASALDVPVEDLWPGESHQGC